MGQTQPQAFALSSRSALGITLAGLMLMSSLLVAGCGSEKPKNSANNRRSSTAAAQGRIDNLQLAIDLVFSDERFRPDTFTLSIATSLNQWADSVTDNASWQIDPMVDSLSDEYQQDVEDLKLGDLAFSNRDAESLQETRWMKGLTAWLQDEDRFTEFRYLFGDKLASLDDEQRAAFQRTDDRLAYLVGLQHPELSGPEAKNMATCMRVFDWIVRNVQLVELLNEPTELEIKQYALVSAPGRSPAAQGARGPGYTLFPWQSLKFGRGDPWQRARVLILAARQLEIDGVMLAVQDGEDVVPWLPALRFGDELYLFDTELGIPVPGSDQQGIATLKMAAEEPAILGTLRVTEDDEVDAPIEYRVKQEQLESVTALLDVGPEWLSRKMRLLESNLTGDRRLFLTLDANAQAERIKKLAHVEEVHLWDIPYATLAYRNAYDRALGRSPERLRAKHLMEEQVFDIDIGLLVGRHRAILGMIEDDEENSLQGSKSIFYDRRFPDEFIDSLDTTPELRAMYGIDAMGDMTAEERQGAVMMVKTQLRMVRTHASYWLALAHFETGKSSSAENWLKRVAENDPRKTWLTGTAYNTARSFESVGEFDRAVDSYRGTESPQRVGNLIRARLIEQQFVQPATS